MYFRVVLWLNKKKDFILTCDLRSHIVDSCFFSSGYATEEAKQVFCDLRRMQRWLEVECALALCQGELGIIPLKAAEEIIKVAHLESLDIIAIKRDLKTTGHSLIPLLTAWQKIVPHNYGQYIHYGATTQDIQDTAQALEIRDIIALLERDCQFIIQQLANLAVEYRDLVMIGRTHGQPALPTTLGLKIAGWLDETLRNYDRLLRCKESVLVSQLFGGVGTMVALSEQAFELLEMFSKRLGLTSPKVAWHNCRDRSAEYLSVLTLLSGGLARAANEIAQLAKFEINELNEPFHHGQIGSSTMPHKVNPELCEQVVVLSRLIKANCSLGFDSLINEHERDYRAVRLEWVSITEASLYACNAMSLMKKILPELVVNKDYIEKNLGEAAEQISSESLMFKLGELVGKQTAHTIIYQASLSAKESGLPLLETLIVNPLIKENFSLPQLKKIISPSDQTGMAGRLIDSIIHQAQKNFQQAQASPETACPLITYCKKS